jgi:hypothetical protein
VTTAVQIELFDAGPAEVRPAETPAERRRRRQAAAMVLRHHPLSLTLGLPLPLHREAAPADDRDAPGRRCGNCRFRQSLAHHTRSYPKCVEPGGLSADQLARLGPPRVSHGEGTDVRAWWPACVDHDYGDGSLSPDAARSVPEETTRG